MTLSSCPPLSRNRAAARVVALAVDSGLLPDGDAAREVMEALGLIEPGGQEVLPDPRESLLGLGDDDLLPLLGRGQPHPEVREPPMDRSLVPAGLRNLSARKRPTERPNCGSPAGYRAHLAAGENGCLSCCDAERDRQKDRRTSQGRGDAIGRPLTEIEHGTESGYRKHLRRDIPVCDPCRDAERAARLARKVRRGDVPARRIEALETPIEHGTNAGYMKERRRGLPPCDLCRQAATRHRARNKRTRPARVAAQERKTA